MNYKAVQFLKVKSMLYLPLYSQLWTQCLTNSRCSNHLCSKAEGNKWNLELLPEEAQIPIKNII